MYTYICVRKSIELTNKTTNQITSLWRETVKINILTGNRCTFIQLQGTHLSLYTDGNEYFMWTRHEHCFDHFTKSLQIIRKHQKDTPSETSLHVYCCLRPVIIFVYSAVSNNGNNYVGLRRKGAPTKIWYLWKCEIWGNIVKIWYFVNNCLIEARI